MSTQAVNNNIGNFLIQNWFRIFLIGAAIYVMFQKDLSFTVNFNAPFQQEKEEIPALAEQEKEQYTTESKQLAKVKGSLNKFELPLFPSKASRHEEQKALDQVDEKTQMSYLKRFAHVAISERKKYGIPSSVILASALLHSAAGQNSTAQTSNNHFGMRDTAGNLLRFDNAWSSFRAHSKYITTGRFEELRDLTSIDYTGWNAGLQKLQFKNNPHLADQLNKIIDKFQLYELDTK